MMKTHLYAILVLTPLGAVGCGTSPPAPPPATAAGPTAKATATSSDLPAAQSVPKPAVPFDPGQGASQPAPSAGSAPNLRDLAARLVVRSDEAWRIDEQAATELEKLGPEAAGQLVPLLGDKDVAVRRGAAFYLLGTFNPNSTDQVTAFSALLDDADQTIRGIGLSAVKQMRTGDQVAAVPRLAAMLDPARESKPENRTSIARLLALLKSEAGPALAQLSAASVGDPNHEVRSVCLLAAAQIAPADEAAALVAPGLADKEASVRLVAAARLRQLGEKAAGARKELAAALADSDPRVSDAAGRALILIGKPAVGALAEQLAAENLGARKLALACLAKIGPDAKDAVSAVEACLADSDAEIKALAAAALKKIKP